MVTHMYAFGGCDVTPSIPRGKSRIDVYLAEDKEKRFKEEVFKRKGMKKGQTSQRPSKKP